MVHLLERTLPSGSHGRAALFFGGVILVYLYPVLLGGSALSPASALYDYFPWKAFRPSDIGLYNNLLTDPATDFQPWMKFARDSLRAGEFPAWNPAALSGTPFFANAQTALLSPFNVPLWFLPLGYAFGVSAALKLWAACFGTYLLVRRLGLGTVPGLVAGLAFGFCAFQIVWLSHPHVNVSVLLPWGLWAVERIMQRGAGRGGLILAGVCAIALLGGHPGTQIHFAGLLGLYVAVRLSLMPRLEAHNRLRRAAVCSAGLGLGLMIAAVALLPVAMLVPETEGLAGRAGGGGTVGWPVARTVAFPDWWGRPPGVGIAAPAGVPNFNERTIYAGAVAVLLAVLSLLTTAGWRKKAPFVLAIFISAQVVFGLEPFRSVVTALPLFHNTNNLRLMLVIQLGIAVLAAFGLQEVLDRRRPSARAWILAAAAVGLGFYAASTLDPTRLDVRRTLEHFWSGQDFRELPLVLPLTSITWWTALAGGVAAAFLIRRFAGARAAAFAVLALVAVDHLHFANRYQPMPPLEGAFLPETPAITFLREQGEDTRFTALNINVTLPDSGMAYGLRDARGHDPPEPGPRYGRLLGAALATPGGLQFPYFTPATKRVLEALSVDHLYFPPGSGPQPIDAPPVYDEVDGTIYPNPGAAPRAQVPSRVLDAANEEQALEMLLAPDFVPSRDAIVEAEGTPPDAADGTVTILAEDNSRVEMQASLDRGGMVVLRDTLADGWTVQVDGRKAKPLHVDLALRGVDVPAGDHTVVWRYRAPGLRAGLGITAAGLAIALAWGIVLFRGSGLARRRPLTTRST